MNMFVLLINYTLPVYAGKIFLNIYKIFIQRESTTNVYRIIKFSLAVSTSRPHIKPQYMPRTFSSTVIYSHPSTRILFYYKFIVTLLLYKERHQKEISLVLLAIKPGIGTIFYDSTCLFQF